MVGAAHEVAFVLEACNVGGESLDIPADVSLVGMLPHAQKAKHLGLREALGLVHAMAEAQHPCLEAVLKATLTVLQQRARVLPAGKTCGDLTGPSVAPNSRMQEPYALVVQPDFCVLWKPPGWTMRVVFGDDLETEVSKKSRDGEPELQEWLAQRLGAQHLIAGDPLAQHGLLHRLDRETSGAVLWARTYSGYYAVRLQFAARRLRKGYVCLCHGRVSLAPRLLDLPLLELVPKDGPPRSVVGLRGRAALTEIVSVGHFLGPDAATMSLVEVLLHTGRQHQIRAHLGHEGHALVGDALYSGAAPPWCPQFLLHAWRLQIDAGESTCLTDSRAPLPREFTRLLEQLVPTDVCTGSLASSWLHDKSRPGLSEHCL